MKKRNIWLINHYAGNMYYDKAGRHYCFAKYLRRTGYNPVVFVANTKHGNNQKWIDTENLYIEKKAEDIDTPFVFVNARTYSGNGINRVLNMLDFYKNVKIAVKRYAEEYGAPDIIFASSVHPLTLVAGIQLAKLFGVECICEVRDLWPESIVAYSKKWTKSNPIIKCLYAGEHYIYKKADKIIFTFEGGYDYIKDQHWEASIPREKVHYINNGIDLEKTIENMNTYVLDDKDLNEDNTFKIIYTGSIRKVNNLNLIINVAKNVQSQNIRFLIWGDGDELEPLKRRLRDEKIENVIFKGKAEKKYIPSIVSKASMTLAHCEATELTYKYGISFNKIFDYMAGGKPIICDVKTVYNPIIQENAGYEISNNTPEEIAKEIDAIVRLSIDEYETKSRNALQAASKYDYKLLTKKLIEIIEG